MIKNKKIINATPTEYDGILFKSKSETIAYKLLKENGLNPQYEVDKVILFKGFTPKKPWYINGKPILTAKGNIPKVRDWEYTPDFKIELDGITAYIEYKGYPNDVYTYKRKLFLKQIDDIPNVLFFEVKNLAGLVETINTFKNYVSTIRQNKGE